MLSLPISSSELLGGPQLSLPLHALTVLSTWRLASKIEECPGLRGHSGVHADLRAGEQPPPTSTQPAGLGGAGGSATRRVASLGLQPALICYPHPLAAAAAASPQHDLLLPAGLLTGPGARHPKPWPSLPPPRGPEGPPAAAALSLFRGSPSAQGPSLCWPGGHSWRLSTGLVRRWQLLREALPDTPAGPRVPPGASWGLACTQRGPEIDQDTVSGTPSCPSPPVPRGPALGPGHC